MKLKLALAAMSVALSSLALSSLATAQPSIYFLWKHKTTGQTLCNPDAPDANWVKTGGPFQDANCTVPEPQ